MQFVDLDYKKYIHHITTPTEDVPKVGWYFSDEVDQLVGPFETEALAVAALAAYEP